ncbi:hypothetical protein LPTSP4_28700 [Leptospira ryugenii]|uniref:MORN repeat protein n=1 Tax=Leptospira ryugenii TaxID=1917863 RepID=A0A2P2E370_9LEPT|nr:hypothetical protein [Leptospira ryugenii]GBF51338.1 hypothetical protein LPTSP4_28700 [Leptospira ryugenii]
MRIIFLFIFLLASSLFAYTPGKWSYKDQLIFSKQTKSPQKEIIRNAEGTVVFVTDFIYDDEGRLVEERYSKGEGIKEGRTVYRYRNGLVIGEEVYSSDDTLVERKEFLYKGKFIQKIITKDESGKVLIHYTLTVDKEGSVIAGEGVNADTNDLESFRFSLDPKRPNVQIQTMFSDKKKALGEVVFKYDTKGQLVEREFSQGETKRVHKLKYKQDGLLESYTFHVKQSDQWVLEKTHTLIYEDKFKNKVSKAEN